MWLHAVWISAFIVCYNPAKEVFSSFLFLIMKDIGALNTENMNYGNQVKTGLEPHKECSSNMLLLLDRQTRLIPEACVVLLNIETMKSAGRLFPHLYFHMESADGCCVHRDRSSQRASV